MWLRETLEVMTTSQTKRNSSKQVLKNMVGTPYNLTPWNEDTPVLIKCVPVW